MVSRKRLIEAGSAAYALATERRVQVVARLLLVAGLVFVLLRIRSIWRSSHLQLAGVEWSWAGGALAVSLCVAVASAFIWVRILRRFAVSPSPALAGVFLQAQLGKYVPGAIWQYAGRGALAKAQGVPVRTVSRSLPIELLASLYAGAAFSFFLVGWWGAIGVVAAVASVRLLAARIRPKWVILRASAEASALYAVASWPLLGASFWMTARAFVDVPASDIAFYCGAFAVAWIVGLFAIYAPGGLGVREAILVALLSGKIGSADALVVAIASRAVLTLADFAAAAVGSLTLRRPGGNVIEPAR